MSWRELRVDVPRALIERVTGLLFSLGTAGVQEDFRPGEAPPPRQPWDTGPTPPPPPRALVRAWFEDPDAAAVEAGLRAGLTREADAIAWVWAEVDDVDWALAWRAAFPVLRPSPRIVIAPPWEPEPGAILIEPGQGFGTGQHPTTRQVLVAIDGLADGARTLLDVGCGSGILALAAARLGLVARGIDNDPVAVADARGNAARNGLDVAFDTTPLADIPGPYDIVVANLFAEVLAAEAASLRRVTGAWLVLAGILADREPVVRAAFDPLARLVSRDQDGEWVSLRYRVGP